MLLTALALVRAHWAKIAGGIALLAFLALFLALKAEKRHSAKLQSQLIASVEGRKADRASYQNAQVAAKAMNEAKVAKIEANQEKISADVQDDYTSDLARLRAELGRLRSKADPAAPRVANRAEAGGVPKPAQGTGGQAGVPLSPSDLLRAAELELQLDALITWVEAQQGVER